VEVFTGVGSGVAVDVFIGVEVGGTTVLVDVALSVGVKTAEF
jgi:hypothetical protein